MQSCSVGLVLCDMLKLRNFCLHKETKNVVVLMRIDKDKCLVLLDKEYENISHMNLKMNYLSNHLFTVYRNKYQHDDGRVSYPLCFITDNVCWE
uniref:Uncharacterized protein n=1 Tax=Castor canadensis TaxID=51338 RepID=A0A8C0WFB7_CASCN